MLGYLAVLVAVVCCRTSHADIQCYQCAQTNETGNCVTDLRGMINSSVGIGKTYFKDCTAVRKDLDRCMILYKETDKKIVVYNRDCHNGTYFPDDFYSPLFDNVNPVNQTVCDSIKGSLVCYRSCNTSFCNGPQPVACDRWRANNSYPIDEDADCGAADIFVKSAEIQCYQCEQTNETGNCVTDLRGMINSSVGIGKRYAKNCTAVRKDLDRCMILYKETDKKIVVYNRDCHNGTYFPDDFYSPLFDNVNPVNQTVCDTIKGSLVCYRSCNTSFCNGPQPVACDRWRANNSFPIDKDADCGAADIFVKSGPLTTHSLAEIQCYQCEQTNETGNCVTDLRGMINSSVGISKRYTKNCTSVGKDLDRCMILYKETDKKIVFYSRDCHNGTYFPEDLYSPLFDGLNPVNQTVCDVIKGSLVCYRSCNTSFCNGPQPVACDRWRANKLPH